jgi:aldehyde:ferredoxin oxidoreductase
MADAYHGRVLHVDLTEGSCWPEEIEEQVYRKYLGGGPLASHFIFRDIPPGAIGAS